MAINQQQQQHAARRIDRNKCLPNQKQKIMLEIFAGKPKHRDFLGKTVKRTMPKGETINKHLIEPFGLRSKDTKCPKNVKRTILFVCRMKFL